MLCHFVRAGSVRTFFKKSGTHKDLLLIPFHLPGCIHRAGLVAGLLVSIED